MVKDPVKAKLQQCGAFIKGHILGASGRHMKYYLEKRHLFANPHIFTSLCYELAKKFSDVEFNTVVGPVVGGVALAQHVAIESRRLPIQKGYIHPVYAERPTGKFEIRPPFLQYVHGKKILVVEDTLTTGGSLTQTIVAVREAGGSVVGAGAIWNRGEVTESMLDVPILRSLLNEKAESWDSPDCPLCKQGIPISEDYGHGRG